MVGQALSREKAFVPGPGTIIISSHQWSINRKSKWPFVSKLIPGELPAHDASFCIWTKFRNDFVDSATVTSFPQSANQLCSCQEAFMGTKTYSGFQNILFTTPWNMSPKASRFHFEHYVSLQDWSPPNLGFYQNICNCLDLYQMKSDSKILNWATLPGAPQMTLSSFLNLYQKMFLSCCYFARYTTKCNMTTKHIEKSCECR